MRPNLNIAAACLELTVRCRMPDIRFTISYLAGTNFRLAFSVFGFGVPREGTGNGQRRAVLSSIGRMPSYLWQSEAEAPVLRSITLSTTILVKGKPMRKAAVVFSAAAVLAMTAVSVPTPVEARGGWGWGPGIAGGLIAGALIAGLASNAYGYTPGYGYYAPGYGYYGGYAPAYYGGYAPAYFGYGYGRPYYGYLRPFFFGFSPRFLCALS